MVVHNRIVGFAVNRCRTVEFGTVFGPKQAGRESKRLRSQNEVLRASNRDFNITSLLVNAVWQLESLLQRPERRVKSQPNRPSHIQFLR